MASGVSREAMNRRKDPRHERAQDGVTVCAKALRPFWAQYVLGVVSVTAHSLPRLPSPCFALIEYLATLAVPSALTGGPDQHLCRRVFQPMCVVDIPSAREIQEQ